MRFISISHERVKKKKERKKNNNIHTPTAPRTAIKSVPKTWHQSLFDNNNVDSNNNIVKEANKGENTNTNNNDNDNKTNQEVFYGIAI